MNLNWSPFQTHPCVLFAASYFGGHTSKDTCVKVRSFFGSIA